MKKFNIVFFDLDGTLTDPGEGITKSAEYALSHYGIKVSDRSELYSFIGPPLIDSFMTYYDFSKEKARQAVKYYREYYEKEGVFQNKLYDGIPQLLKKLKKEGNTLSVATSKPEFFAEKILKIYNIEKYFDFVAGANMDETRSKKSDVIAYAIDSLGISPEKGIVMVGDRSFDVEGAAAFNIPTIGVLYGYGSETELLSAGAFALAKTPAEVYEIISEPAKRQR